MREEEYRKIRDDAILDAMRQNGKDLDEIIREFKAIDEAKSGTGKVGGGA